MAGAFEVHSKLCAEAFMPVQSDLQTSEWYSYFENDVLASEGGKQSQKVQQFSGKYAII